jgi:predicted outer membrane repeat protein
LNLEQLDERIVPAVYNVNSTADILNPPAGVVTLRSAIEAANATPGGNTINLTVSGTYKITIPPAAPDDTPGTENNASGDFDILPSGGNLTIKNTSGSAVTVSGNALDRVFDINPNFDPANPTPKFLVTLTGFNIISGVASPGDAATGSGGGIRDQGNASLTLNNVGMSGNSCTADGGAIAMENTVSVPWTLTLNNCKIVGNNAGDAGGGVETDGSGKVFITLGTVIANNTSVNQGAGIWLDAIQVGDVFQSANLAVTGATISGNQATAAGNFGGGIGNAGNGAVTIAASTIQNNFVNGTGGGFADQNGQGNLTVLNSLIQGNIAAGDGGGIAEGGPVTQITSSEIRGNAASGSGGGVFANGVRLIIGSSTIAHNTATNGAGVEVQTTGFTHTFSTVPPAPGPAEQNPYGVAYVPPDFPAGGTLQPGDLLIANFNNAGNTQGTGTTIVRITPDGQRSTFFTSNLLGLDTALAVLRSGFVIVGNVPNTGGGGIGQGALQILDKNGNLVQTLTDATFLKDPWDLTVNDQGSTVQVFVSNVVSGTVTRLDLQIMNGMVTVMDKVQIASGYATRPDMAAFVVGPGGVAFDPATHTLYVASTAEKVNGVEVGTIFAIANADTATTDNGKGTVVYADPTHLHGPIGLVLAPNGDLITANSDAVNVDPNQPSELVEFTPTGHFVGQFSVDPANGGAFGLNFGFVNGQFRFAAVNDNAVTVIVWNFLPTSGLGASASSITNTTIAGNFAVANGGGNGGGIDASANFTGDLLLLNDTINANFAGNGGGVFWAGTAGSTFSVQNTIIAKNSAPTGPDVSNAAGMFTDLGGNLIGINGPNTGFNAATTQAGTAVNPISPELGPLGNNGGPLVGVPTKPLTLETEAPLAGSPAIGKGILTGAPDLDERGFPSVTNGKINVGAVSQANP